MMAVALWDGRGSPTKGAVPACAGLKSVELGGTTFPGDPEKGPRSLEAIRGVGV